MKQVWHSAEPAQTICRLLREHSRSVERGRGIAPVLRLVAWYERSRLLRFIVEAEPDFLRQAARMLALLRAERTVYSLHHVVTPLDSLTTEIPAPAA